MTEKVQIYKCDICGNVVSVLEAGDGDLACCGENMRLLSGEEAQKYWADRETMEQWNLKASILFRSHIPRFLLLGFKCRSPPILFTRQIQTACPCTMHKAHVHSKDF
jgi:desulfoferrodoxin-like iron-binding protein